MNIINSILKKWLAIDCICEHHFIAGILTDASIIVDLGANKGEFFNLAKNKYGGKYVLVEPDGDLFAKLPVISPDQKFQVVISTENKLYTFYRSENKEANSLTLEMASQWHVSDTVQVQGFTFDRLAKEANIDAIDLLKIDIEGAELDLLSQLSREQLTKIRQITCEFHDFMDLNQMPQVESVLNQLSAKGFIVLNFSKKNHRDVLLINADFFSIWNIFTLKFISLLLGVRRKN